MTGRPLFKRELGKDTPGPKYDVKRNIELVPLVEREIQENKPSTFGSNFGAYRKTMDITKGINVYESNSLRNNPPMYLPNVDCVKKRMPVMAMGKSK